MKALKTKRAKETKSIEVRKLLKDQKNSFDDAIIHLGVRFNQ